MLKEKALRERRFYPRSHSSCILKILIYLYTTTSLVTLSVLTNTMHAVQEYIAKYFRKIAFKQCINIQVPTSVFKYFQIVFLQILNVVW